MARIVMVCVLGAVVAGAGARETHSASDAGSSRESDPDYSSWAVDPNVAGPNLPPLGRSLFDYLVMERAEGENSYRIPFPLAALIDRIQARLGQQEYAGATRITMIPMGRSLQRTAAAPDFFKYPRIVFAVTGEPRTDEHDAGALLKDRVYLGYVEKTGLLEVISYNEAAGRFEFQIVKDYRAGSQPKVFYSNRAICISCHQNHAPIFSKAIWGETSANGQVAELLSLQQKDFHRSAQANIDFPDDIDKATVRANTLVTLQRVWQEGCSDPQNRSQSRRCRAAAFTAVLQYGLSGDFDSTSPTYQSDFVSTLGKVWRQKWPQGLSVAQSNLPDRNPFGGVVSAYASGSSREELSDWIAASNVPAELDPLKPRLAREIWQFAGAMDTHRFIAGWARFFAKNDFRTLDAHLVRQAGNESIQRSSYQAHCVALRKLPAASEFKLQCPGEGKVSEGIDLDGSFDTARNGHLSWITFGPAGQVRDLVFETGGAQRLGSDYVLRGVLKANGLAARLPDGRVLAGAEIRWPATASEERASKSIDVHFQVVLLDDFALVRQGVGRLLAKQPSLFDDVPLVRPSLMSALFSELGMAERSWCCIDDADMPPPLLDPSEASASVLEKREWQPFFQYCAMCHLTHEQFPPNFLSGDATHVADNLRQCAPRMLVRLLAWRTPVEQRVKSPMPPATAMHALGTTTRQWAGSDELEVMRTYLEGLARQAGQPSDPGELFKHGYEGLPKCLSDAN